MTYLQVPFAVTNASLFDKGFESPLYCLDRSTDKSDCNTKKNILQSLMTGAGLIGNKPYFITVTGRDKPGMAGKIELVYY